VSDIQTAVVQTLVAEVKVLMVGSRQVTLSVAKQLDHVPLSDLETFGRVKLGGGDDRDYVIGRHRLGGALALATYNSWTTPEPYVDWEALVAPLAICDYFRSRPWKSVDGEMNLSYHGRVLAAGAKAWTRKGNCDHDRNRDCGWVWVTPEDEAAIVAAIADCDARSDLHKAAAASPLIVLAGLR
jgi:hypothetical protein